MFHGSIAALVTPMTDKGEIDFVAFERLIKWHIEQGTDAICVLGTTGEASTLTVTERVKIVREAVKHAAAKISVIVGTGTSCTRTSLEYSKMAMDGGADGILVVTPYYNRPSQKGMVLHYETIAEKIHLPMILYNVPARTGVDLNVDSVALLSDLPNIVAIKEASGSLNRFKKLYARCATKLDILSGDDALAVESILNFGAKGVISVTANVLPGIFSKMIRASREGNEVLARKIEANLQSLQELLFIEANPIPVKWLLSDLGYMQEFIRPPLTVLTKEHQGLLKQSYERIDLVNESVTSE